MPNSARRTAARLPDLQQITRSRPSRDTDRGGSFFSRRTSSVSNGCRPDSKPAPRGFDSLHRCFCRRLRAANCRIDNWICHCNSPGAAQVPGESELWASGQATSFGMRGTGVRISPARPGARSMLSYRPSGRPKRALRRKSAVHPAQGATNARGSIGESTCLRSRRLQVQVLPGVLCPKQKRAMHRDVAPEKAGSSPAGHPATPRTTGRGPPRVA
jgi:hypothetical protein